MIKTILKIFLIIICIGFISAFIRGVVYQKEISKINTMDKIQTQNI